MSNCGCGSVAYAPSVYIPSAYAPVAYQSHPAEDDPQYHGDVVDHPICGRRMTPGGTMFGTASLISLGVALFGAKDTSSRLMFGVAGLGLGAAAAETYRQSNPCRFHAAPPSQNVA